MGTFITHYRFKKIKIQWTPLGAKAQNRLSKTDKNDSNLKNIRKGSVLIIIMKVWDKKILIKYEFGEGQISGSTSSQP